MRSTGNEQECKQITISDFQHSLNSEMEEELETGNKFYDFYQY